MIFFNDLLIFLEIIIEKDKEVFIGKMFSIKFKIDVYLSYFINLDVFLVVIEFYFFGSFIGFVRVIDGYGIVYFKVRDIIEINIKGLIILELRFLR